MAMGVFYYGLRDTSATYSVNIYKLLVYICKLIPLNIYVFIPLTYFNYTSGIYMQTHFNL